MTLQKLEDRATYRKGYQNGFTAGQADGIKMASKMLLKPAQTLVIECADEENAKLLMEQFKK